MRETTDDLLDLFQRSRRFGHPLGRTVRRCRADAGRDDQECADVERHEKESDDERATAFTSRRTIEMCDHARHGTNVPLTRE